MLWNDLSLLFSQMGLPAAVCLATGLVLCVLEIFNSFRGWLAGMGAGLILTGMVLRLINDGTPAMFFWMLFIIGAVVTAAYLVMIRLMRYTWLSRTPAIQGGIPDEDSKAGPDYYFLLGREGMTLTELCPYGKIDINNTEITAVSKFGAVLPGEKVRVIEVEEGRVIVAEIQDG